MATSTTSISVSRSKTDVSERHLIAFGTITVAAGDYATGGLTLSLADAAISASWLPVWVDILSPTSGYTYRFNPGTTLANGKMLIFVQNGTTGPLAQLAAAATPAGVTGDTINFQARFTKSRVL